MKMRDKLIYYIYQQFSKGTRKLYLWLTFLSILPILILSLIIFVFPNSSPFSSFLKTFYSQLLAALDPGNLLVFELVGLIDGKCIGVVVRLSDISSKQPKNTKNAFLPLF